jgi:hypothetical protein
MQNLIWIHNLSASHSTIKGQKSELTEEMDHPHCLPLQVESTCFGDWFHPGNQRVCVNPIIRKLSRSLAGYQLVGFESDGYTEWEFWKLRAFLFQLCAEFQLHIILAGWSLIVHSIDPFQTDGLTDGSLWNIHVWTMWAELEKCNDKCEAMAIFHLMLVPVWCWSTQDTTTVQ